MFHNYSEDNFDKLYGILITTTNQLISFDIDLFSMLNQTTISTDERNVKGF